MNKRLKEVAGMSLIGDGVLTLLDPQRHCLLWEIGPQPCREFIDEFAQHPTLTRVIGALEIVLGLWLATHQKPKGL